MAAKRASLRSPAAGRGSTVPYDDANIPEHTVFHPVPSTSGPDFDDDPPAPLTMKRRRTSATAAPDDRNDIAASLAALDAASRNVAPFLAKHIPTTYANPTSSARPAGMESQKFCNRHRPDVKCRRQANEPTMDELQNVRAMFFSARSNSSQQLSALDNDDQQGISHVWSLFSAAPAKHRELMLQGVLAVCCFPQLSFVSATVKEMLKIDFMTLLPIELSFKVLGYLDTVSLCKAAQVSKQWNQLAEDDIVWHKMCQQHIEKKCKKCGWGLPLMERKRLEEEKNMIKRRAELLNIDRDRAVSEAPSELSLSPGIKRPFEESAATPSKASQPCPKRPWKEVYKSRFKVGTNWKYGRFSLKPLKGHTDSVMCLDFQDNILASGSYDTTIRIWDMNSCQELRVLRGHTSGIRSLQMVKTQLISSGLDKTIKIWNWESGQCIRTMPAGGDILSINYDSSLLCAGGHENTVRFWGFSNRTSYIFRGHTDTVNSVRIDQASKTVFSGSDDGTVRLWDLNHFVELKVFAGHVGGVQQIQLLPPEFELDEVDMRDCARASGDERGNASDSDANGSEAGPAGSGGPVVDLPDPPLFPDEPDRPNPPRYLLTGSLDSTLRLWHVPTGRCLRTFFGHLEGIWALGADNLRVASGAQDRMVKIWDPRTGKCERTFTGHAGPVTCLGLSGERLVTGSEDHDIRVMEFSDDCC
jgi:F-box/WD-40 domain protein MET30